MAIIAYEGFLLSRLVFFHSIHFIELLSLALMKQVIPDLIAFLSLFVLDCYSLKVYSLACQYGLSMALVYRNPSGFL